MCQLASSPPSTKCNVVPINPPPPPPYLPSIRDPEADMLAPLIPKTPTPPPVVPQNSHKSSNSSTHDNNNKKKKKKHFQLGVEEARSLANLVLPTTLAALILYPRSMISMVFLGRLGDLALAGGSLAVSFANITGYSVLSGLAVGMEPICGQAFGAKKYHLLGLSLQRTVIFLVLTSVPIAFLWINMRSILLLCGQEPAIASQAQTYLLYSIPDLLAQSLLHPIRIYLRSQSITLPLTVCAVLALLLHVPINYVLVTRLHLGVRGVALGGVWTNCNLVAFLVLYILVSGVHKKTWACRGPGASAAITCSSADSCRLAAGWRPLLDLAVPSCVSVCLEWWWYEIMIVLCGLLPNPTATVASMGVLIQTTSFLYIFPSSLSSSVSTRVSNELGANQPARARVAALTGLSASFAVGLSALAFAVAVRGLWARMFTADEEIIALTSAVLPIIGLCELGNCPQTTLCGVLRGSARPRVGANVNLGCFYLVGMPVAVALAFLLGLDFKGLWLGLLAAQGACVVAMLIVLLMTNWEIQAARASDLTSADAAAVPGAVAAVYESQGEEEGDNRMESRRLLSADDHSLA